MRRTVVLALAAALVLPACGSVPGFCGASAAARSAIAQATPEDYPAVAGEHVGTLRQAAGELDGEAGDDAQRVTDALARASEQEAGSVEFTEAYNEFVELSNAFDRTNCVREGVD